MADVNVTLTPLELWLAAGRYLLMISGWLLGIKHLAWLLRRDERIYTPFARLRHQVEMSVGFTIGVIYALQWLYSEAGSPLTRFETVVITWAFGVLLLTLVVSRQDNR